MLCCLASHIPLAAPLLSEGLLCLVVILVMYRCTMLCYVSIELFFCTYCKIELVECHCILYSNCFTDRKITGLYSEDLCE